MGIVKSVASAVGSFILTLVVSVLKIIFGWLGSAFGWIFTQELNTVQSYIKDQNGIHLGTRFDQLLQFNAIIIPSLAAVVFLLWLVAKGIAGGNSKSSTEEMLKKVIGAMVISTVLTLVIPFAEQLVGALDGALLSVAHLNNNAALGKAFAAITALSTFTGVGPLFMSIIVMSLGLFLAGFLIFMLILAQAAAFLLIYFAPYMVLFRKEGFRESVEGVVAALSLPFIITSVLAVGITTMSTIGVTSTASTAAALGSSVIHLSAMVHGHLVSFPTTLAKNTTSLGKGPTPANPVQSFSAIFGGLLILGAGIFLPFMILKMVFQAGAAMHEAIKSSNQQLAGKIGKPLSGGEDGKLSNFAKKITGGNKKGDGPGGPGSGGGSATDRSGLQDVAVLT